MMNFVSIDEQKDFLGIDPSVPIASGAEITLPNLKYGYRTVPLTWVDLKKAIVEDKDLARLARGKSQQSDYEIFRYHVKQRFKSVIHFILCSKFGFEQRQVGGKVEAYPPLREVSTVRQILMPNDFPYYTERGIVHYILWKLKQPITNEDVDQARSLLQQEMQIADMLHWVNPPHLQSLPEIDHVHFLCLLEDKAK